MLFTQHEKRRRVNMRVIDPDGMKSLQLIDNIVSGTEESGRLFRTLH